MHAARFYVAALLCGENQTDYGPVPLHHSPLPVSRHPTVKICNTATFNQSQLAIRSLIEEPGAMILPNLVKVS